MKIKKYIHKKSFLIALPLILIITTYFAYKELSNIFGIKLGYFLGFIFYWGVWGIIIPLLLLSKNDIKNMIINSNLKQEKNKYLLIILTLIPVIMAIFFGPFFKRLSEVDALILILSLLLAVTNAITEELLWRGLYTKIYSNNLFMGYIYPAITFGVWHISPNAIVPSSQGIMAIIFGGMFIGLCWGFVSYKTKSIKLTIIAHIILDLSGFGALIYLT